jgi:YD repeat-containing protein
MTATWCRRSSIRKANAPRLSGTGSGDSRLKAVIDANNHATTLTYATLVCGVKALSGIERPGHRHDVAFGYTRKPLHAVTDYDGNVTSLSWDSAENRTSACWTRKTIALPFLQFPPSAGSHDRSADHRTTTMYDTSGNATSIANELNEITTLTYDSRGDATTVFNPLGTGHHTHPGRTGSHYRSRRP